MRRSEEKVEFIGTLADELEPSLAPRTSFPRRSWFVGGAGIVIGIAIAAGGIHLNSSPTSSPAAKTQMVPPAQSVTIAPVEMARLARTLDTTGTVAARDLLPVLPQATGLQIQQIRVEEGKPVEAGQVMAVLDNSVLQGQLMQAKANLAQTKAHLAELRAGSRSEEIAQAQANVALAEAQVMDAQSGLNLASERVKRNQALAASGAIARDRLDEVLNEERSKRASLEQAEARVREAKQRLAQLQNGSRPETIAQAEAQFAEAQGRLRVAEAQLEQTLVRAPASGIVAEKLARIGDVPTVIGSQKLFSIIRNGSLELQVKVPEAQSPAVQIGVPVLVTSDADKRIRVQGRVREIAPLIDPQTRQATVKIDLPASKGNSQSASTLRSGMFLRAAITSKTVQGLTVPAKAVLPQADGKAIVYLLKGKDRAQAQTVEVGEVIGGTSSDLSTTRVEIKRGLKLGDRVIVAGAGYLKDGDRVQVVPESI